MYLNSVFSLTDATEEWLPMQVLPLIFLPFGSAHGRFVVDVLARGCKSDELADTNRTSTNEIGQEASLLKQ